MKKYLRLREIRGNCQPVNDLHRKETLSLVESGRQKLHKDEFIAIRADARLEMKEKMEEMQHKVHLFITEMIAWVGFPYSPAKLWGLIYALDLPLHDERNLAETARLTGCTRAAISVQMQHFAKTLNIQPSRWMRDDEAVENSRQARIKHCEQ